MWVWQHSEYSFCLLVPFAVAVRLGFRTQRTKCVLQTVCVLSFVCESKEILKRIPWSFTEIPKNLASAYVHSDISPQILRQGFFHVPQVQSLLEVLPNRLTGDVLEQLRISKQTLVCLNHNVNKHCLSAESQRPLTNYINASLFVKVELGSRAGDLRQMLFDLLEDTQEIRRICIMGRNCTLNRFTNALECSVPLDKEIAEGESHRNLNAYRH